MKFKVVLLCSFLAMFSMTMTFAQGKVSIGVRGGVTIPGFTGAQNDPVSEGYSTSLRMGAGIFAEFKISDLFSIQPMLEYSQQGAKRNGMQALVATGSEPQLAGAFSQVGAQMSAQINQTFQSILGPMAPSVNVNIPVPDYLWANAKRDAKMDYLMLPVLAKFGWNFSEESPWRVYVDAGPYVGLLVTAKNTVGINGSVSADKAGNPLIPTSVVTDAIPSNILQMIPESMLPTLTAGVDQASQSLSAEMVSNLSGTQDIKKQLNKFNWGLEANAGLQYQIKQRNRVFIEVGGNYGMMNIQKSTGTDSKGVKQYLNGKNNIGAITAMIGYAYTL